MRDVFLKVATKWTGVILLVDHLESIESIPQRKMLSDEKSQESLDL